MMHRCIFLDDLHNVRGVQKWVGHVGLLNMLHCGVFRVLTSRYM